MALKNKMPSSFDFIAQARKVVNEYLQGINVRTEDVYVAMDGEVERIALLLQENNGLLTERIRIRKLSKDEKEEYLQKVVTEGEESQEE